MKQPTGGPASVIPRAPFWLSTGLDVQAGSAESIYSCDETSVRLSNDELLGIMSSAAGDVKNRAESNVYETQDSIRCPSSNLYGKQKLKKGCKDVYNKIHFCVFCKKETLCKTARHLLIVHKNNPRVSQEQFSTADEGQPVFQTNAAIESHFQSVKSGRLSGRLRVRLYQYIAAQLQYVNGKVNKMKLPKLTTKRRKDVSQKEERWKTRKRPAKYADPTRAAKLLSLIHI